MVQDARQRTKVYLDAYLDNSNLTKDDDTSEVNYLVAFGYPDYPILKVFHTKRIDLIFSIGDPESTALLGYDLEPYGYHERVPIKTFCVDKPGITGTKLRWKAEAELRRVAKEYPEGSQRSVERMRDNDQRLGSTILYSREFILDYKRDTT